MLATLRQRNFALLWLGGLISFTGDWMLIAALPFYVYQQTGSTLATAAMSVAAILPSVLLGSLAGVFVDRWDRKRVMVVANLLQMIAVLFLLLVRSNEWSQISRRCRSPFEKQRSLRGRTHCAPRLGYGSLSGGNGWKGSRLYVKIA
jgi:MFS family permease